MTAADPASRKGPLPVYLLHYDAPDWCASACRSILGSEHPVTVAVVDNGQRAGPPLRDVLPDGVRLITVGRNAGYAGAANVALADAREHHPEAAAYVVGSHDLHVDPPTFGRLVDVLDTRPDAGVVAPALDAPEPAGGGVWRDGRSRQYPPDYAQPLIERDWVSGTCLVLRATCVDAVGDFDEVLGSYVEDVDYGLRANDAGWSVLVVTGAHARGLGSASPSVARRRIANTVLLNAKRGGGRSGLRALVRVAGQCVRSLLASVAPWRSRELRATSRAYLRPGASALLGLLVDGRLLLVLRRRRAGRTA